MKSDVARAEHDILTFHFVINIDCIYINIFFFKQKNNEIPLTINIEISIFW